MKRMKEEGKMSELRGKIDFELVVSVSDANPNGDPLNGNRPRENYEGFGEMSAECIKRKIRNRIQDFGGGIFVQSDDRADDGCKSLKERADHCEALNKEMKSKTPDANKFAKIACEEWYDVRAFGQVFAFKGESVSVGVRGPVSIRQSISVSPVDIISTQITKSVNSEATTSRASDTMGMKHRVGFGLYLIKGSVNVQLAEKTGFSQEDAELLKEALQTLFENDASAARPEGSMEVCKLYWWQFNEKTPAVSTAKVHRSVQITPKVEIPKSINDYMFALEPLKGAEPEIFDYV